MNNSPVLAESLKFNAIHNMDALDLMRGTPANSVDAIMADPPYNLTKLDFETEIDWAAFWGEARRILRTPNSPTILFSQQPFTTDLIVSNRKGWRDEIVWEKTMPVGFLNAKRRPLEAHELIEIFADKEPVYFPQMETQADASKSRRKRSSADHYNSIADNHMPYVDNGMRYPRSVWKFAQRDSAFKNTKTLHPTQKPLALMQRLVLTYTRVGDIILDPFAGSGTTALAAATLSRRYIINDINPAYCEVAGKRLSAFTPDMFEVFKS